MKITEQNFIKQFGDMSRGDLKKISIKTEKKGYTK